MPALTENGLKGGGLFMVEEPELVARYNACLRDMGIEETKLETFGIDATGASPDIAKEKEDPYYLAHGEANQLMIILSPEQRNCSIWTPYHSFDWDMIKQFYDNNRRQIAELTQRDAIWVDIDQEVGEYHDVSDLLLVDHIVLRAYTPARLMVEARSQRDLIRHMMTEHDDFLTEVQVLQSAPAALATSVSYAGDIAHRSVDIPDMPFTVPRNFYTRAFGGTFVLRSADGGKELILPREQAMKARGVTSNTDKAILKRLDQLGLISYDIDRWVDELHRLRVIRDSFLMDVLDKVMPELNFVALSEVQQKGVINNKAVSDKLPEEYHLLRRLVKALESGKKPARLPAKIKPFLAHPLPALDKPTREVVWYVLSLVCDGRSIVRLYRYDKDAFYHAADRAWKTPWQSFAIHSVHKYHESRLTKQV